jgi:hypothetical protein
LIFLEQNPEVKTFDLYRPSWEFLKDSPKFASITHAHTAACGTASKERKQSLLSTDSTSPETPVLETPTQDTIRPIGKKKTKRKQEEDKMIENVTEKLKSGGQGNAGMVLAGALTQFANVFSAGLQEWRDRQAYNNASPTLKKRYDNLIMHARIQQLEEETLAQINKHQQPSTTTTANDSHTAAEQHRTSTKHHYKKEAKQVCNNVTNDMIFSDEEVVQETQV